MRSRSHGLSREVLEMQSGLWEFRLAQGKTNGITMKKNFAGILLSLKEQGITDGVFGDIDFEVHRELVERVCNNAGFTPHLRVVEDQSKLLNGVYRQRF